MLKSISSYRVEEEIARGGMGVIYRAVHTVFDEVVAIKAIFPELTVNPEFRARFLNEAKIQRRLQHPNIVQIREFLSSANSFYIIMEYVDGETLAERLKRARGPLPLEEALEIFCQALRGLAYAHSQGVIHRDIKPSNFIIPWKGGVKLTDFGIARAVEGSTLTKTGFVLGTPAYMAPEQIQGQKIGKAADIYSMGVTLYEMVTGRAPFTRPAEADTDFPVLEAHVHRKPPVPTQLNPSLPPFVEAAILKALAKKPEQRFPSCEDFEKVLKTPEDAAKAVEPAGKSVVVGPMEDGFLPPITRGGTPPAAPSEVQSKPSPVVPEAKPALAPYGAGPAEPRVKTVLRPRPEAPSPSLSAPSGTQPKPSPVAPAAKPRTETRPPTAARIPLPRAGGKLKYWIAGSLALLALAGTVGWHFVSRKPVPEPVPENPPPAASAPVEQTPAKKKSSRGLPKSIQREASKGSALPASSAASQDDRYTAETLKRLAGAGLSDQQILRLVKKRGINFTPTPAVLEDLRKGGVPESVLQALGSLEAHP